MPSKGFAACVLFLFAFSCLSFAQRVEPPSTPPLPELEVPASKLSMLLGHSNLDKELAVIAAKSSSPKESQQSSTAAPEHLLYSGAWRVDHNFVSTIRLKNTLAVASLEVIPTLYMADGANYQLPAVTVPISGVATFSVNDALTNSPSSVSAHLSEFGSISLSYRYPTTGHLVGSMSVIDVPRSLSYTYPFNEPEEMMRVMPHHTGSQKLEAVWWKHDKEIEAFVSFSNTTAHAQIANLQLLRADGSLAQSREVRVAPKSTLLLDGGDMLSLQSVGESGGMRVEYNDMPGALIVAGGLINDREGYSANLAFWPSDEQSKQQSITYASAGIMVGMPDPAMGFPDGTTFTPYLVLRNTTDKPVKIKVEADTMAMPETLLPLESRQIDLQMLQLSSKRTMMMMVGMANISVSFEGRVADVLMASGSVDQSGSYVFEVEPQGTGVSEMKIANYWSVGDGNDTMFSLWNPTGQEQDLMVTFHYAEGSGQYEMPVHLTGRGSAQIDLMQIIEAGKPDASGSVIPKTVKEGSLTVADAADRHNKIWVVMSGGVFNVKNATCGTTCITCCGTTNFVITPNNFSCTVGDTVNFMDTATDCNGFQYNIGASSNWSSSNTSMATITSSGTMSAWAPGSLTITDFLSNVGVYSGQMCAPAPSCPQGNPQPQTTGNVMPTVSVDTQDRGNADIYTGSETQILSANKIQVMVNPTGGTLSCSSSDQQDTCTITTIGGSVPAIQIKTADVSASANDRMVTVKYTYGSLPPVQAQAALTARQFHYLTNTNPYNSGPPPNFSKGYYYTTTYDIYTYPRLGSPAAGQIVAPNVGLGGTSVTEVLTYKSGSTTIKPVQQNTILNANSEFVDNFGIGSNTTIPATFTNTYSQQLTVGGYLVRTNTLKFTSTQVVLTNNGPIQ